MKMQTLLIITCVLAAFGCSRESAPVPEEQADTTTTSAVTDAPAPASDAMFDDAFIKHMHRHAERMDDLNLALADGDLEAARTPAYWLSRHDTVDGVHPEWQGFLTAMRSSALDVEKAPDLESAQIASLKITAQCQGCHDAAGLNEPGGQPSN